MAKYSKDTFFLIVVDETIEISRGPSTSKNLKWGFYYIPNKDPSWGGGVFSL